MSSWQQAVALDLAKGKKKSKDSLVVLNGNQQKNLRTGRDECDMAEWICDHCDTAMPGFYQRCSKCEILRPEQRATRRELRAKEGEIGKGGGWKERNDKEDKREWNSESEEYDDFGRVVSEPKDRQQAALERLITDRLKNDAAFDLEKVTKDVLLSMLPSCGAKQWCQAAACYKLEHSGDLVPIDEFVVSSSTSSAIVSFDGDDAEEVAAGAAKQLPTKANAAGYFPCFCRGYNKYMADGIEPEAFASGGLDGVKRCQKMSLCLACSLMASLGRARVPLLLLPLARHLRRGMTCTPAPPSWRFMHRPSDRSLGRGKAERAKVKIKSGVPELLVCNCCSAAGAAHHRVCSFGLETGLRPPNPRMCSMTAECMIIIHCHFPHLTLKPSFVEMGEEKKSKKEDKTEKKSKKEDDKEDKSDKARKEEERKSKKEKEEDKKSRKDEEKKSKKERSRSRSRGRRRRDDDEEEEEYQKRRDEERRKKEEVASALGEIVYLAQGNG
eukprot:s1164_g22.t3